VKVASYNVLADGYIRRSFYPGTAPALLEPARRRAAVAAHVAALDADVVCLQEVEPAMQAAIAARLPGHAVEAEAKRGKPDAVATFVRRPIAARAALAFPDGTGHVALLVVVDHGGRRVGVANTHVKWDPPGAAVGLAQVEALLDWLAGFELDAAIVAGDFNAAPDSPHYARVRARGFGDAGDGATCNSSQVPKRIDFLFHSPALYASAAPLAPLAPDTPLPSETQPSDHLAVAADFSFA
jgi:endonuclease/exonuclease/phosphatase family metal-dependent hydrolase